MSGDGKIYEILLSETRSARTEANNNFRELFKRMNALEIYHAKQEGASGVTKRHAGYISSVVSALVSGVIAGIGYLSDFHRGP